MPSRKPHPLNKAVKDLRLALGDTQQQFAHRLDLAISTVVRYELTRPPKGKALAQLEKLAADQGLTELVSVFSRALNDELGLRAGHATVGSYVCPKTDEPYLFAFCAVLERSKWAPLRRKLIKLLEKPADEYREHEAGKPPPTDFREELMKRISMYAQLQKELEAENRV